MITKNNKNILLVEDEAIIAITQKKSLENSGYNVITANSGLKAIEIFKAIKDIDLILMDIDLGSGINGPETATIILKDNEIPIVFLSSHIEPEIVEKTESITSYGYVVKNSGITVLDASIKMALKLFMANTDLKMKDEKLKESEENFRYIFENVPIGMYQSKLEGIDIYVNREYLQIFGYESTEEFILAVTDKSIEEVIYETPSKRSLFIQKIERGKNSWKMFHNRYKRKSGEIFDGLLALGERVDPISGETYLYGFVRDVTAQNMAEEEIKIKNAELTAVIEELESTNEELNAVIEELEATNEALLRTTEELEVNEKNLRKSEEKFRSLFQNIDSFNSLYEVIIDENGKPCDYRYLEVNAGFEKLAGKKASEIIGRTLLEVFPQTEKYWLDKFEEVTTSGVSAHIEDYSEALGTYRDLNIYIPQKGQLALTSLDITELKHAEQLLDSKNRILNTLLDNLPIGVFMVDALSGKPLVANEIAKQLLGRGILSDVNKESIGDAYQAYKYNTDEKYPLDQMPILRGTIGEKSHIEDMEVLRPDGTRSLLEVYGSPVVGKDGIVSASLVSFFDITEKKRAEDVLQKERLLLKNITETSPVGIATVGSTGNITYANPMAEKILGLTRNDIVSRDYDAPSWNHTTLDGEPFPEEQQPFYIVKTTLKPAYGIKQAVTWPDGRHVMLSINASPVIDENGQFSGMVATFDDITEQKQAEDKIINLLSEKELILKETHHRIKNFLNTINGLIFLQSESLQDPIAISALKDTESRIKSMMFLYEKLYSSNNFKEISVMSYIPSLIDEILSSFPNTKSLEVVKNIKDFIIESKKIQPIGIIINELITNIMKYAFIGRSDGIITLVTELRGDNAVIIIQDNGVGIPEGINFENSSGFGMQLIKMLSEQIKASISIERGEGTKVVLQFLV